MGLPERASLEPAAELVAGTATPDLLAIDRDTPALHVQSMTAGYRAQPIIFDVTLDVYAGRITTIIGPNGAGKSTLFKALYGVATVFEGHVAVAGEPVRPLARLLVRRGIAYVPQVRNVFPSLSVRENLEVGTYIRGKESFERVFDLFPDLAMVQRKAAGKLSGGQRNMLAVGRALMSDPTIVLLDEATGGLSPLVARKLWEHLAVLARNGVGVAAIEQNVKMALDFADYVYVLAGGKNLLSGKPAELAARPDFGQMFLEGTDTGEAPAI